MRQLPDRSLGRTVVVVDTPHDRAFEKACGCQSIAGATGIENRMELACGQPDLFLDDVSDTGTVLAWLERMSA